MSRKTAKPENRLNGVGTLAALPDVLPPAEPIRLDLGCGSNKRSDKPFIGVDRIAFPGVDVVCDLATERWPWEDGTVEEVHASHFVEHLTGLERVHFVNELYRVLRTGGQCTIITPHWCSTRAYGDFTHQWPPVSEMWFYYLSREWRLGNPEKGMAPNAPHTDASFNPAGYTCDFEAVWGNHVRPEFQVRSLEASQFAQQWYKEVITDLQATLTKR